MTGKYGKFKVFPNFGKYVEVWSSDTLHSDIQQSNYSLNQVADVGFNLLR